MCKAILSLSLICFRTASCKVGISKEMWIKNAVRDGTEIG